MAKTDFTFTAKPTSFIMKPSEDWESAARLFRALDIDIRSPVTERRPGGLLTPNDPPVYDVINPLGQGNFLIVADHASNKIPEKLGDLGISAEDRARHIAWDPGTEEISRQMSAHFDAPGIIAGFSRLVVDLNRGTSNAAQMPQVSDGTIVPANQSLSKDNARQRVVALYQPYHAQLGNMLDSAQEKGKEPVVIFVHSFTPEMEGKKRPWHIGVLWNKDRQLAKQFMRALNAGAPELNIGDNRPYSLLNPPPGNTIEQHAERRGLPHLVIEFRQDLVDTPEKAAKMGKIAIAAIEKAVARTQQTDARRKLRNNFSKFSGKKRQSSKSKSALQLHERSHKQPPASRIANW